MPLNRGQASGDFREFSGRLQPMHVVTRNSYGALTPDAFTQANPAVVTATPTKSTTWPAGVTGILAGSVAFTRPDVGNGYHGGPASSYLAGVKPLGLFANDALGNSYENKPAVASGAGSFYNGVGTTIGVTLWETQILLGGSAGNAITYASGDKLYASANGLLTNVLADAYEYNVAGNPAPTLVGIVRTAPDANNSLMVVDLRI
jgi:hypothetical protein